METHGPSQDFRSEQAVSGMKWRLRCSRARDKQRGNFGKAASRVPLRLTDELFAMVSAPVAWIVTLQFGDSCDTAYPLDFMLGQRT